MTKREVPARLRSELIDLPKLHPQGVQEVVADEGYHSNAVLRELRAIPVRSYIAEPERGRRKWKDKPTEREAVYGNRRRIQAAHGKRLLAQRGEKVERNCAHQFHTGGLDRLYVTDCENVHNKLLLQAAACNLALLLRRLHGSGKPKAASDRKIEVVLALLGFMDMLTAVDSTMTLSPDGPT